MVEFLDPKSVQKAIKLNGQELDGRSIEVQLRSDNRGTKKPTGSAKVGQKRARTPKSE